MRVEHGFTLLELMVAMTIFAVLAVAGWQVFDGVTRAREKAQYHADNLAALQYAYLQLQQDMGQIVAYQAPSTQEGSNQNTANETQEPTIEAFMSLNGEQISFVRFADPDPRYQISPSLQRVDYIFSDQRLIRRQYSTLPSSSLQNNSDSVSLDTALLDGITEGRWQAYTPELSAKYPNPQSASVIASVNNGNNNANSINNQQGSSAHSSIELLPVGIGVSFTYQDMPITWQWALAPKALPQNSKKSASAPNTDSGNSNSANNDTDNNDNSVNNDNNGNNINNDNNDNMNNE